jgi:hypothetical protein
MSSPMEPSGLAFTCALTKVCIASGRWRVSGLISLVSRVGTQLTLVRAENFVNI